MERSPLIRLFLRAPLEYAEAPGLEPFGSAITAGETMPELLFCFDIDPKQAGRINPETDCFPGTLVFSGMKGGGQAKLQLPAGMYLFVQQKGLLSREECVYLAIEQHKDGLWERHQPGTRLYIRLLFEDGSPVTQLFRPCHLSTE